MTFIIRNNPKTSSQPLYWNGEGMVGILRANEAQLFASKEEAQALIDGGSIRGARFYDLIVAFEGSGLSHLGFGQNGWMVRHPGYDPVH